MTLKFHENPIEDIYYEELWIMDYGLWIMDYGLWIMDYGLWIMDYGLWIFAHR